MEFEIFTKPLSVNQYYATSGRRIYVTAKGKQYKLGIINGLKESNITKLEGDLKLDIQLKLTKRYKMDVDNCLKPLLDSFEGFLYNNDSQIIDLRISKIFGYAEEIIVVRAEEVPRP